MKQGEKVTLTSDDVATLNIVAGVGTAVKAQGRDRAKALEVAMLQAVERCIADAAAAGKPFPSDDEIRAAKLDAYERAKAQR